MVPPSAESDQHPLSVFMASTRTKRGKKPRVDWSTLVDRGANGCIAGNDMRVIAKTERTIDLSGIDDHTVRNLTLVTAGGVVRTQLGNIIMVLHQAADMTRDLKTILSAGQLESFGCIIKDKSPKISKEVPSITTVEGYQIPIAIKRGLPYIRMRPFTDNDWNTLPHITFTSPAEWTPSVLDSTITEEWYQDQDKGLNFLRQGILSEVGDLKPDLEDDGDEDTSDMAYKAVDRGSIKAYLTKVIKDEIGDGWLVCETDGEQTPIEYIPAVHDEYFDAVPISCFPVTTRSTTSRESSPENQDATDVGESTTNAREKKGDWEGEGTYVPPITSNNPAKVIEATSPYLEGPSRQNHAKYAKYFPGANIDSIKKTFRATTQLGTRGAVEGFNLRNRILAPNPMLTAPRRNEDVATDTLYSRTPAIDDGSTAAQFFIGRTSNFRSIVPLGSSDKQMAKALMDEIRKYGAMDRLISDNAKAQISERVKEILRTFCIKDWQSEPYKGNQNYAERGWKDTKTRTNNLLNMSGAPPELWLQALAYVCTIQNHSAVTSLNNRTPIEWLLGYTPDITVLLQFQFWEPVYYAKYDAKFPADSTEMLGRFVGIAENVGNAMTFKVLTSEGKIIHRSVVRSAAGEGAFINIRADSDAAKSVVRKEEPTAGPSQDETSFESKIHEDIVRSKRDKRVELGQRLPNVDASKLLGRTFISEPDEKGEQLRAKIESIIPLGDHTADG